MKLAETDLAIVGAGITGLAIAQQMAARGRQVTLLDKGYLGDLGTSHLVARQELRELVHNLRLPMPEGANRALKAA